MWVLLLLLAHSISLTTCCLRWHARRFVVAADCLLGAAVANHQRIIISKQLVIVYRGICRHPCVVTMTTS